MGKQYKLEIEACHTDDERIYRSKGHHGIAEFLVAARSYGISGKFGTPVHLYIKTVPSHKNSDYSCLYVIVEKGTRGSYPATYIYEYGDPIVTI